MVVAAVATDEKQDEAVAVKRDVLCGVKSQEANSRWIALRSAVIPRVPPSLSTADTVLSSRRSAMGGW
jgi:hypothetical protein